MSEDGERNFEGSAGAQRSTLQHASVPAFLSMSLRHLVVALALLAFVALCARAEPLTFDGAVKYALAHNRELAAATLGAEAARGRVEQAGLRANPALEAGAQTDLLTGNTGARKFDLGLTQAIPLGNRLREAQAVARVGDRKSVV